MTPLPLNAAASRALRIRTMLQAFGQWRTRRMARKAMRMSLRVNHDTIMRARALHAWAARELPKLQPELVGKTFVIDTGDSTYMIKDERQPPEWVAEEIAKWDEPQRQWTSRVDSEDA